MLKIGLIGAGRIGKVHAENIAYKIPGVQLKTIADILLNDNIKEWAHSIGVENVTKDAQEIFSDPEIDAVLICSSSDTHEQYIIEAAKAGKHIFCEKPIGSNIDRIKEALEIVENKGVKLQIGFVRRFDHNHKKVHDAVKEGKVGEPYLVKITSRDPQPPSMNYLKVSGGLFFDMTIHDFDMARYLSDSEVEELFVHAAVLVDPTIGNIGDVDTAVVTMKFKNGMLGVIDNCRKAVYGYDQRTEVHGSKGCIMVENDRPNTSLLLTNEGILSEKLLWFFLERYNEAFAMEIKAFIDAIINDSQPLVTGIDGLKAVLIANAAEKSAKEGKPIKVAQI
ncbi:inositol 2-dehydrogenase [Neomoorella thermoacetica]|uniref:inositol 2-dehydrogenase n=1 Tax=Neomoorella thermoacetica TaxID=1525 RepID=UPI0008FA6FF8|nr:inositol 2-dehydrogenase [Moorella thermoacetica]OIQ11007.1 inositol 2-dehydrogenase [Moorella thermoacetica]